MYIIYIYIHTRKYVYIYIFIYIFTYGYSSWQSCLYRRAGMCLNMLCFLIQNRWDGARNTDTKSKQAIHGSWPNKFSFHRLSSICHSDDSPFSILGELSPSFSDGQRRMNWLWRPDNMETPTAAMFPGRRFQPFEVAKNPRKHRGASPVEPHFVALISFGSWK